MDNPILFLRFAEEFFYTFNHTIRHIYKILFQRNWSNGTNIWFYAFHLCYSVSLRRLPQTLLRSSFNIHLKYLVMFVKIAKEMLPLNIQLHSMKLHESDMICKYVCYCFV